MPDTRSDRMPAAGTPIDNGGKLAAFEHGGNLAAASRRYGIAPGDWLDLSTGISPFAYPVPAVDASAWQRLPYDDSRLMAAASAYYGCDTLLPVAGSQAAIQGLTRTLGASRVAIVSPTYGEYRARWEHAGAQVRAIGAEDVARVAASGSDDLLVLCNPNNPTAQVWRRDELRSVHASLRARGAWLMVDEAFMDSAPDGSLLPDAGADGLVVLRSIGKFFGLAGARVGFVAAPAALRERLRLELGPWTISGPALEVAAAALGDTAFHQQARERLQAASTRLAALLGRHGFAISGRTHFFAWSCRADARVVQDSLARRGVLVRAFDDPPGLRFGLPGNEQEWARLDGALEDVSRHAP